MNKVLDIVGKICRLFFIPISILGLVLAPIILGLCVVNNDHKHKFRIWWFMTREFWIADLKYIWMVFTFRMSDECYEEIRRNAIEKAEEIMKKEGEL